MHLPRLIDVPFVRQVGPLKWLGRTAVRQFHKRVTGSEHHLELPSGVRFPLPLNSRFASEAYVTGGNVDWGAEALFRTMIPEGAVFFDVGANIGYYSAWLADRCSRIVAFEPDPRARQHLERLRLQVPHLEVRSEAVSNREGTAELFQSHAAEMSCLEQVGTGRAAPTGTRAQVTLVTLDAFASSRGIDRVAAIKTDVEGHDLAVLEGARRVLVEHRPLVLSEIAPTPALFDLTRSVGYDVFGFARPGLAAPATFRAFTEPAVEHLTKMLFLVPGERVAKESWIARQGS